MEVASPLSQPQPLPTPSPPVCRPMHSPGPPPLPPQAMMIPSTTSSILPLKMDKPVYSSPPPAPSNPENNTCKMIDYRGAKIAAFAVENRELICLPQAFDLFLKHLVGGLHTVYTKLKRLDIIPVVCNVEQVRILRGLGAIQPGVNRCKLISPREFDILYEDCTNSSARPGRPPKRSAIVTATPETLEKLKKSRMDNGDFPYSHNRLLDPKKSPLFGNGYQHYPPHLATLSMPFMPLGHPMMTMAMANHIGMRPDGSVIRDRAIAEDLHRAKEESRYEDSFSHIEHNNNKPIDKPLNLQTERSTERRHSITDKESGKSTPSDVMTNGQLDLSMKSGLYSGNDDLDDDADSEDDKDDDDDSDVPSSVPNGENGEKSVSQNLSYSSQMLNTENTGISSVETLLMNIQGLLKVAAENARHRERQINFEKAELKMELMREREMRENLEKQLLEEQRNRNMLTKRLKKEKKARRKLQDQVEVSIGGNISHLANPTSEDTAKMPSMPSDMRLNNDSQDSDRERLSRESAESDRRIQDAHSGLQNLMETFLGSQKPPCNGASNGYIHPQVITKTENI